MRTQGINVLGTAVVAIILGAMLQTMGERGKPLLNVFEVLLVFRIYTKDLY